MKRTLWMFPMALALSGFVSGAAADNDAAKKLTEATAVYHELISSADHAVPVELLEHAKCVAVFPGVIKAALGVGARHGKGVMTCRTSGGWTAPAFVTIGGGSAGFQIGAESTDLVLFFMNERGVRSLINGSRITLGGKASVAAGPFGRSGEAATDLELKAEIYSYARSKGLFAGLSVEGARLAPDKKETAEYYGPSVTPKQLLFGKAPATVPAEAEEFRKALP
jgi:lipid-binding SYLF domain-containing protein